MKKIDKKVFLYSGLMILCAAFFVRGLGVPSLFFWILFGLAISLKGLFLVDVFREKGFKPTLWLLLIVAGVVLICISVLFKTVFHLPVLRDVLFYMAIALKLTGLLFMLFQRKQ
ncbi:hypothetical protein [Parabacteroides sp. PF5-9]|uniref:hypothetical protein n=1 Tax=Parabacteroides sp. PF5-9 TaxID=1742404 RepID=UPI002474AC04|nr:hypothetical protein [Parabacteroides sp. PF5-9]MDH6358504.1 hypothetical protein [Parabacteroides sp. PF5-9]